MDLLSTDPARPGIFAVGQEANGIFALGQMATGVVAVGQLARGFIVLGQGAIGIVAVGQGALGVLYGIGMIGLVGRGKGFVLQLLPGLKVIRPTKPVVPVLRTLDALQGEGEEGWVEMRLDGSELRDPSGIAFEVTPKARGQLMQAAGADRAYAQVVVQREVALEGKDYRAAPDSHLVRRVESILPFSSRIRFQLQQVSALNLIGRVIGLAATAAAWWYFAGADVVSMFIATSK